MCYVHPYFISHLNHQVRSASLMMIVLFLYLLHLLFPLKFTSDLVIIQRITLTYVLSTL